MGRRTAATASPTSRCSSCASSSLGLAVGLAVGAAPRRGCSPACRPPFRSRPSPASPRERSASGSPTSPAGAASSPSTSSACSSETRRPRCGATLVTFHSGLAFLAQVGLFIVLGLFVFPRQLGAVILPGLAVVAVLLFVARPIAVWLSTIFQGFTARERTFLGWAGPAWRRSDRARDLPAGRRAAAEPHDLQRRLLRRRRVGADPGADAGAARAATRPDERVARLESPRGTCRRPRRCSDRPQGTRRRRVRRARHRRAPGRRRPGRGLDRRPGVRAPSPRLAARHRRTAAAASAAGARGRRGASSGPGGQRRARCARPRRAQRKRPRAPRTDHAGGRTAARVRRVPERIGRSTPVCGRVHSDGIVVRGPDAAPARRASARRRHGERRPGAARGASRASTSSRPT